MNSALPEKQGPVTNPETRRTAIVVLNYNGEKFIDGLLNSLSHLEHDNYRVFFVDNASKDNSISIVNSFVLKLPLEIIENTENLLFAGGNNVGIKRALEWGAEFIFLLNNDTIAPPKILKSLTGFLEDNKNVGIVGPMIHFRHPENTIWFAGGYVSTWWGLVRHRGIRQIDSGQFDEPAGVDYISGCALVARREVWERVGFLDEKFPMYYEDTDFCFRAKKAGFECRWVPTDPVIHLVSASAGGQMSRFKIGMRFFSGMRFFTRWSKWYQWPTIIL
ncbi:MAG: glycosyltransferase family 2 protein, partial [bacterium]